MTSYLDVLRAAMLTAALTAACSTHGPARAGEQADPASQAPVVQTAAIAERHDAPANSREQPKPPTAPVEAGDGLVTGDGQPGSVAEKPIACVAPDAGCHP